MLLWVNLDFTTDDVWYVVDEHPPKEGAKRPNSPSSHFGRKRMYQEKNEATGIDLEGLLFRME